MVYTTDIMTDIGQYRSLNQPDITRPEYRHFHNDHLSLETLYPGTQLLLTA